MEYYLYFVDNEKIVISLSILWRKFWNYFFFPCFWFTRFITFFLLTNSIVIALVSFLIWLSWPPTGIGFWVCYPIYLSSVLMDLHLWLFLFSFFFDPGIGGQNFPRVITLPSEMSKDDKLEPTWGQLKLERSKTERHNRHGNLCAEDAAQILDDRIPVQQKVYHHLYHSWSSFYLMYKTLASTIK